MFADIMFAHRSTCPPSPLSLLVPCLIMPHPWKGRHLAVMIAVTIAAIPIAAGTGHDRHGGEVRVECVDLQRTYETLG